MNFALENSLITKIGSISSRADGIFYNDINLHDSVHIDLWLADLNQAKSLAKTLLNKDLAAYYQQILSPAEQQRAALMGTQRQQEFMLTRGILRELLSSYTAIEPQYLKLAYSLHGKPYLDYDEPQYQIPFSVSHTRDLALYSVIKPNLSSNKHHSKNYLEAVGIDLEFKYRSLSIEKMRKLVQRYFLPQEQKIWHEYLDEPHLAKSCFLRTWTAKEAYAKATGLGLAQTLTHLDTSQWFDILKESELANLPDLKIELTRNPDSIYTVRDITPLLAKKELEYISAICWQNFNH
ncbi:MAG: 4'-phosphopantetheinyl transferase superfamily protein [Pseudanabaena sp. ELA607]